MRRLSAVAREALAAWGMQDAIITPVHHFHNTTFRITTRDGERFALRLAQPDYQTDAALISELVFIEWLESSGVPVAAPVAASSGELVVRASARAESRRATLSRWVDGRRVARVSRRHAQSLGTLLARMHRASSRFVPPAAFERPKLDVAGVTGGVLGVPRERVRSRTDPDTLVVLDAAAERYGAALAELGETNLVHADLHGNNVRWRGGTPWAIDFDDMGWAPFAYDLAVAVWAFGAEDPPNEDPGLVDALFDGYAEVSPLPPGSPTHIDELLAGRRVLDVLWLTYNLGHPSFAKAPVWIARELRALRDLLG